MPYTPSPIVGYWTTVLTAGGRVAGEQGSSQQQDPPVLMAVLPFQELKDPKDSVYHYLQWSYWWNKVLLTDLLSLYRLVTGTLQPSSPLSISLECPVSGPLDAYSSHRFALSKETVQLSLPILLNLPEEFLCVVNQLDERRIDTQVHLNQPVLSIDSPGSPEFMLYDLQGTGSTTLEGSVCSEQEK
ncbi:hypothetical protein UY3_14049 [Chelonia mydas]|uniref:Uncharacterized protein n=1 Tax=Chelonia mydas TaxID=8469 RepID=M7BKY8_CHEMY|nr:hypothetical protein UY3_14049 [Chelonia mydas]